MSVLSAAPIVMYEAKGVEPAVRHNCVKVTPAMETTTGWMDKAGRAFQQRPGFEHSTHHHLE